MTIRAKLLCVTAVSAIVLVGSVGLGFLVLHEIRGVTEGVRTTATMRSQIQEIATLSAQLIGGQKVSMELQDALNSTDELLTGQTPALAEAWQRFATPTRAMFTRSASVASAFERCEGELAPLLATFLAVEEAVANSEDLDEEDFLEVFVNLKRRTGNLRSELYKVRCLRNGDERNQAQLAIGLALEGLREVLTALQSGSEDLEIERVEDASVRAPIQAASSKLTAVHKQTEAFTAEIALLDRALDEHVKATHDLLQSVDEAAANLDAVGQTTMAGLRQVQTALLLFGLLLSVITIRFVVVAVGRPLHKTKTALGELLASAGSLDSTSHTLENGVARTEAGTSAVSVASAGLLSKMEGVGSSAAEMRSDFEQIQQRVHEMRDSIQEVVRSARSASAVADEAAVLAASSDTRVQTLGTAAGVIGNVVTTIQDVAFQTNLLALNAAVEAARAGEAGKGFAVVADEVKELAKATANATQEIREQVDGIQSSTDDTVQLIQDIGAIITKINHASKDIAESVDGQNRFANELTSRIETAGAFAAEVATSVASTVEAGQEIQSSIREVEEQAQVTARGAEQTRDAGKSLTTVVTDLSQLVERF